MADPSTYLRLRAEDHARFRQTAYGAAFVAWIEHEQNQGIQAVLYAVREKKFEDAFYACSKADTFGEIVDRMYAEDAPAPDASDEVEQYDPAMPESERRSL